MTISLENQIAELNRELFMRQRVYPGRIAARHMTQAKADEQVARIKAAVRTLEALSKEMDEFNSLPANEDAGPAAAVLILRLRNLTGKYRP